MTIVYNTDLTPTFDIEDARAEIYQRQYLQMVVALSPQESRVSVHVFAAGLLRLIIADAR